MRVQLLDVTVPGYCLATWRTTLGYTQFIYSALLGWWASRPTHHRRYLGVCPILYVLHPAPVPAFTQ